MVDHFRGRTEFERRTDTRRHADPRFLQTRVYRTHAPSHRMRGTLTRNNKRIVIAKSL